MKTAATGSLVLLACLLASTAAHSQWSWTLNSKVERLDQGRTDWREQQWLLQWRPDPEQGHQFEGGYTATERYGLRDETVHAGVRWPISNSLKLHLEAGYSATHQVVAQNHVAAQLALEAAPTLVWTAGLKQARYQDGTTRVANLGTEWYRGSQRLAYTVWLGGPEGVEPLPTQRLQWAWHFSDLTWAGVHAVAGHEASFAGPGRFVSADLREVGASGRWHLGARWSLWWSVQRTRWGELHLREGVQIGLQHGF